MLLSISGAINFDEKSLIIIAKRNRPQANVMLTADGPEGRDEEVYMLGTWCVVCMQAKQVIAFHHLHSKHFHKIAIESEHNYPSTQSPALIDVERQ